MPFQSENHQINFLDEQISFQDFFEAIPTGMVIIGYEHRIFQANGAFLRMIGRSTLQEILHKCLGEAVGCINGISNRSDCGTPINCHQCLLGRAIDQALYEEKDSFDLVISMQQITSHELQTNWFKANVRSFSIKGTPYCSISLQNITHFKILEEELSKSQDKAENWLKQYELLSQNTREIILFACENGQITEANLAACQSYGYSQTELLNLNISDLEAVDCNMDDRLVFETWHKRKSGRVFPVQVSCQKTCIHGQRMHLFMIRDISEQKNYEVQLKQAIESANSAYKAKSYFLANMSHEVRTPLNGMMGMIDLTLSSELNDDQRENLVIAKKCAESLLKVLNDILDVSKLEVGKFSVENTEFDLLELVEQIAKTHGKRAEHKGLQFFYQIAPEVPRFFIADPYRLQQILNNLMNNAIKFTDCGKISLSICQEKNELNESCLKFEISDTGIGISPRNLEKIFDDFSQVDSNFARRYSGTGLGLSICKRLVDLMNGEIWAESQLGEGSSFFFTLPDSMIEKEAEKQETQIQENDLKKLLKDPFKQKGTSKLDPSAETFAESMALLEQALQEQDLPSVEIAAGMMKQIAWEKNLDDIRTLAFQLILSARRGKLSEVNLVFDELIETLKK